MAQLTDVMETYDASSIKEDISQVIFNLDPDNTPVLSNAGRRDITNTLFQWQVESLPTSAATNKHIEGAKILDTDAELDAGTATTLLNNYTQISWRNATVSGTLQSVSQHAKAQEMAHQMALRSKQLKIDLEKTILSHNPAIAGAANGTARQTESLPHMIGRLGTAASAWAATDTSISIDETTSTKTVVATSATGAHTDATTAAGSLVVMTEARFMGVANGIWDNGGELDTVLCNGAIKREISDFGGRGASQIIVSPETVANNVTLVQTDFGDCKVMMDRHMTVTNGVDVGFVDWDYVNVAFLRPFTRQSLAVQGDASTENLLCEWGIQMSNVQAFGWMFDVNKTYA
jgi:hypothetical protein